MRKTAGVRSKTDRLALATLVATGFLLGSAATARAQDIAAGFLDDLIQDFNGVANLVAISASAENQLSWATRPPNPQSIFTGFLIQGLAGAPPAADGNADNHVSAEEIFAFADPLTRAVRTPRIQTPTMFDNIAGDLVITRAPGGAAIRGLFLGNTAYPGQGRLPAGAPDAQGLRGAVLVAAFPDWAAARATIQTDRTAAQIAADVNAVLAAAGANDAVVIYFSGHGNQINDANGDEAVLQAGDTTDEVLVGIDGNNYTDDQFRAAVVAWRAGNANARLAVVIDACFSGGVTEAKPGVTIAEAYDEKCIGCSICGVTPSQVPSVSPAGLVLLSLAILGIVALAFARRRNRAL